MGHRVAVLKDGLLQQCDTPRALYDSPANAFVAGFIGSPAMNLLELPVRGDALRIGDADIPLPRDTVAAVRAGGLDTVTAGIRPESLSLATAGTEGGFDLVVELVEELGADALVHATIAGSPGERVVMRVDGRTPPALAQTVTVTLRHPEEIHLFDPRDGARLV
ncbi:TOBE domain-containing protein, partial [Actinokineospora sp.]|uniref:TOBE domain-containing protein n=1 Tax=Actinokineospora sp. TaxID=1872133 RepID=UPI0040382A9A